MGQCHPTSPSPHWPCCFFVQIDPRLFAEIGSTCLGVLLTYARAAASARQHSCSTCRLNMAPFTSSTFATTAQISFATVVCAGGRKNPPIFHGWKASDTCMQSSCSPNAMVLGGRRRYPAMGTHLTGRSQTTRNFECTALGDRNRACSACAGNIKIRLLHVLVKSGVCRKCSF